MTNQDRRCVTSPLARPGSGPTKHSGAKALVANGGKVDDWIKVVPDAGKKRCRWNTGTLKE